jgi:CheY-like chemotaxis protein
VISAFNGREGIQKALHNKPDLILMDIMMPDMGGFEAVQVLKNSEATRHIPVIFVTANNYDPSTIEMMKSEPNVVGFISKPFRPKGLRETVRMAISKQV